MELGRAGDVAAARMRLGELWARIVADGEPLHRCALAHYMADLQDDAQSALDWDLRALEAADSLTDQRGFRPSLHLNVADDYRRVGDVPAGHRHLELARDHLDALTDDGYGQGIRAGIGNVERALADGSTERLPTN